MKNVKLFEEFIKEDKYTLDAIIQDTKSRLHAPMDSQDTSFDGDNLKIHIEKDKKKAEDDMESTDQTIKANKELKVGDFVVSKHRQALGVGSINKIHPNKTHADVHFVDGLQSSLIDDKDKHDVHTMEIIQLMPVIGTQG